MLEERKTWFNPNKDIQEVDQFGFIDLPEAFANNSVPTSIGDEELIYNNMEDPSAALDMPKDIFEVMHQNKTVHDYKSPEEKITE